MLANNQTRKKILLGQLGANGDCLYATTIARQIKHDYPDCHLTWAIGSPFASILLNNPHVDKVWEIPMLGHEDMAEKWLAFEKQAAQCQQNKEYDEVFLTQIYPNNFQNYDGTIRASILRAYPNPITVPVSPVICLTEAEITNARAFAQKHQLESKFVILFEYSHKSAQSFVTPEFALAVAQTLAHKIPNIAIIFSSHQRIDTHHPAIIDGSSLTFRENAALTTYCDLLIGCSSGISWLSTAEGTTLLPTIQLLKRDQAMFASMSHDFQLFGLDTKHIIEMTECAPTHLVDCVMALYTKDLRSARQQFHEIIPFNFNYYFTTIDHLATNPLTTDKYSSSLLHSYKRYGDEFFHSSVQHLLNRVTLEHEKNAALLTACAERLALINKQADEIKRLQNTFFSKAIKMIKKLLGK